MPSRVPALLLLASIALLMGSEAPVIAPPPPLAAVAPPPAPPPYIEPSGAAQPQDPPSPRVSLQVRVPASVGSGKELEYRLCVKNGPTASAHHVKLRDAVPSTARFVKATPPPTSTEPDLVWDLGTLKPNDCREIILVLMPTGQADVKNCARVQFEHGQCVTTRIARPELTIAKRGPVRAAVNDALTYRIDIRNTGGIEASSVVVTDTLPDGLEAVGTKNPLTWELGTLQPGQSRTVEYQALARKAGVLTNVAVATASGGLRAEARSTLTVGEAKLELDIKGPERRVLQRPVTYQLTVTNNGTAALDNVVLSNPLPAKTAFLSASDGGRLSGSVVQWPLGGMAPGSRRTVQLAIQPQEPGEIVNKATVAADRGLRAEAQARTPFEGAAGLTADVEVKDNPVEVGKTTTYVVTVVNQGTVAATSVRIIAMIPAEMEVVSARGPSKEQTLAQQVSFEPIPSLAPRAEGRYEITVKALRAAEVRFQVELTSDQLTAGPVKRQQSTHIFGDGSPGTRLQPPEGTRPGRGP